MAVEVPTERQAGPGIDLALLDHMARLAKIWPRRSERAGGSEPGARARIEPTSIARLIFDTIPQIYQARAGAHPVRLGIPEAEEHVVYSVLPLSDSLRSYLDHATRIWGELQPVVGAAGITQIIEREWIQQKFAVAWLEAQTGIRTWNQILDYTRRLSRRTIENQPVSKTLVIEPGEAVEQTASLTDSHYRKVFDWLGSSPVTYYRVTSELLIKGLEAVSLSEVKDLEGYRFHPDQLHPIISSMRDPRSVVVHLSENRSLLIANREGILATKRNGESWIVYDREHLVGSVARVMERQLRDARDAEKPYCVACSLFQVLFDISMKRHGGLVILDHPENVRKYVVRGIERDSSSPLNRIFTHSPFDGLEFSTPEVRKLVELSSVDGALILDLRGNLIQVGSMVIPGSLAMSHFGTREAAAYSAARAGATAFKVSADGQVTMFFTTPARTSDEVHRFELM